MSRGSSDSDFRFDIWPVLEYFEWDLPSPRGVWQTIKCGAHADSHASCRISSDIGQVFCQGCGFKNDAIGVVQHYEGLEYKDAVAKCEQITGAADSGQAMKRGGRKTSSKSKRGYVPPSQRGQEPRERRSKR